MSSQSYSSISTVRRRGTLHDDIDRSVYTVGQTLASIVNDPRTAGQTGGGFWGLGQEVSQPTQLPPLDPAKYPPVTKADVQRYIDLVHGAYDRFIRDRQSLEAFDAKHQPGSSDPRAGSNQGEPFIAAVQAVPMQFFQEGFFDTWDDFFKQYCKEQSADELYEQIDQLNRNLDVVELQLLREVASRSDSFFRAAASLQHLLVMLGESVGSIHRLRSTLAEADEQMYSTAVAVKALQHRRSNLQATLDITKGLEEVMAAQQALDCMLESQDYAGALELLDQLKALLEQPGLIGLQCVRHLPPRLVDTTAAVERALANEFLNTISHSDVAQVVAESASDAEAQPDASISSDGRAVDNTIWKLPTSAAKRSISPATEQLQEKLLPLAVGLYRADRLGATLQQYKANVGDEVKAGVRDAVQQVLPVLLVASGDMPSQQQQAGSETQLSDQLQMLHHGAFMVLLHAAARVIYSCVDHTVLVRQLLEAILTGINAPASQLASLRKECSAALQVVVDVALGRWVKLLAARSTAHTRLRQYELRQLLDLSEQVAAYTESLGARTISTFRSALQSQCKGLLDSTHARAMNQLQHLLESEQWVAVEVPGSFQAIVDRLVARCGEGAALLDGRAPGSSTDATAAGSSGGTNACRTSGNGSSTTAAASTAGAVMLTPEGSSESHSPTLHVAGKSFHLVNSALMLLKMVDEYMSLYDLMPQFGAELVHRELELLKLFNSQTCALVLGAGAMRTAGLRSISAKQLALSCQAVAILSTLLPLLRAGSLALVSQPRRALLMPEFDRLLQDLTMHMDEIHSKLVDIMRDRLAAATQALPAEVKAGNSNVVSIGQPSPTIALLVKQLGTLRVVLVPYLLKEEVEFIFGAVARAYSDALSETFEVLMDQDSSCELVVKANALAMLQVFRELPLDPTRSANYCNRLTTTYTKHFGLPPWDLEKLGDKVKHQQQPLQSPSPHQDAPPSPQPLQRQQDAPSSPQPLQQQQPDVPRSPPPPQQQQQAGDDVQQQPEQHQPLQQSPHEVQQPQEHAPLLTQQEQQDQLPKQATEQPPRSPLPERLHEHLSEQLVQQQQQGHDSPGGQQPFGQQWEQQELAMQPGSTLDSLQQQQELEQRECQHMSSPVAGLQQHLEQQQQQQPDEAGSQLHSVEQHYYSSIGAADSDVAVASAEAVEPRSVIQQPQHDEAVHARQDQQQQKQPGALLQPQQQQQQVELPSPPAQEQHQQHTVETEHNHSIGGRDSCSQMQQHHAQPQQQLAAQADYGSSSSSAVELQQPGSSTELQLPENPGVGSLSSWVEQERDAAAPQGAEADMGALAVAAAKAATANSKTKPAAATTTATPAGSADTDLDAAAAQAAADGTCAANAIALLAQMATAPAGTAVDSTETQVAESGSSADTDIVLVAPSAATQAASPDRDNGPAAIQAAAAASSSAEPVPLVPGSHSTSTTDVGQAGLVAAAANTAAAAADAASEMPNAGLDAAYASNGTGPTALDSSSSSTDGSLVHAAMYGLGGSHDGHSMAAAGTAAAGLAFMEAAPLPFADPAAAGRPQAAYLPQGATADAAAAADVVLDPFDLPTEGQTQQEAQGMADQVTADISEDTGTPDEPMATAAAAAPVADLLGDWSSDGMTPGTSATAGFDAYNRSGAAGFSSHSTGAGDATEPPLHLEQQAAGSSSLLAMLFDEVELHEQQEVLTSLQNSSSDAAAGQPGSFTQQLQQQQRGVPGVHISSMADAAVRQPAEYFQELFLFDSSTAAASGSTSVGGSLLMPACLQAAPTGSSAAAADPYSNGLEGSEGKQQQGAGAQRSAAGSCSSSSSAQATAAGKLSTTGSWDPLNAASAPPAAAAVECGTELDYSLRP